MSDLDIDLLRDFINAGAIIWWSPDSGTARRVVKVGDGPPVAPDDEPEPAECAYFANGEYVSLAFAEARDFVQVSPLFR